jgi:C-terminal processing protease CtpA/Prc
VLNLTIQSPAQEPRNVEVMAKVRQGKQIRDLTNGIDLYDYIREAQTEDRERRHRYGKIGEDIFIWKMTGFDVEDEMLDAMLGRVKKCKSLILDLRGNGGGYVSILQRLVSNVFDREVKISDRVGRKEMKPVIAKKRGGHFDGKIIVLIDSGSGSASEVFARVLQLEKRGLVIGDVSAGAVMESRGFSHQLGQDTIIPYSFSITDANVIMTDGKSLEHVGVIPDELLIPTAKDLAAGRDVVLARALALLGANVTPEDAGKMFPVEWLK